MTTYTVATITASIIELHDAKKNKGQIEGFLKYTYDMSVNDTKAIIKKVYDKNGWNTSSTTSDYADTVTYLRANYGKINKTDLINGMCNINGKKYSSNQHSYNYIAMAIEWSKQEQEVRNFNELNS